MNTDYLIALARGEGMFLYPSDVASAVARFSDKEYLSKVYNIDEDATLEQLVAILEAFWAKKEIVKAINSDLFGEYIVSTLRHELPVGSMLVIDWEKTEEKARELYTEYPLGFQTWLIEK